MKTLPLLRFHNKDLTVTTLANGEKQAFFRQTETQPDRKQWLPCDGITYSKHTPVPAIAETRRYWNNTEEAGVLPGEGNKELKAIARELNAANLPAPADQTTDPALANEFLGTETSLELNIKLESLDQHFHTTDQRSLQEQIDRAILKAEQAKEGKSPEKKSFLHNLVELALSIGEERTKGSRRSLVPAKTVLAILVLTPLLTLSNLQASDPAVKDTNAKAKVTQAYNFLQKMDGDQIKALLKSIPEDQRVDLVKHLPSHIIPPFIPKDMAARNVSIVPSKDLKKGFSRITEADFETSAAKLTPSTRDQLFKLLLDTIGKLDQAKKAPAPAPDMEPA